MRSFERRSRAADDRRNDERTCVVREERRRGQLPARRAREAPSVWGPRRVTADQLVRRQLRGQRRAHPSGDQRAGGLVFAAEEFTGLVNFVDQIAAFVRDKRANLDLWPGQTRFDGGT